MPIFCIWSYVYGLNSDNFGPIWMRFFVETQENIIYRLVILLILICLARLAGNGRLSHALLRERSQMTSSSEGGGVWKRRILDEVICERSLMVCVLQTQPKIVPVGGPFASTVILKFCFKTFPPNNDMVISATVSVEFFFIPSDPFLPV